ncbi:MAG TPA: valine--tRNA ligase [Verrucomicrobiae bacterium]|jgi:valyl-tRNA synthetase|nr:valine--tRNA ligase [Verrucomicrobiae bacterium]
MPEIPKAYEPRAVEEKWYRFWLDSKCFAADPQSAKPAYSIVIPPPNVTGVLTLGHVLNNTIQDILARLARMKGFETLWLPGTDHAGIATQTVVEKSLRKQGVIKHRDELGRDKFLEKVWEWKEKHGGIIIEQLKRLGASCDWERERFTMDPEYSRCVQNVFIDLYHKGLIYRGKRMVNWDPSARTALSDEEVEMVEERGKLWHFKYPLADDAGRAVPGEFVMVATTRPETMLGDEAVAVHPSDPRYANLIGRRVLLPLRDKLIPIIADELVDPKFGTGCVKVTPAHDPADYEMGMRHQLPMTVVIAADGRMSAEAGEEFARLDRMEARKAVVEKLEALGLMTKAEDYTHRVGYSQRSNVPIEPYLSSQWFLKYPAVEKSTHAVAHGEIRFHPERWSKTYLHWMGNIKDWCISRQLWWGHRIPIWRRDDEEKCQIESPGEGWTQDSDVLDTWFSSWLWPFATMGWPQETSALKKFYPTTDLVTGPDIIFFWVARMIMAGYEYMGEKPFQNVYFTGIIRDKQGRKMSKSLGNSPDPLDLINQYGADALRFGVMRSAPLGQDVLYDEQQVELGRNFCNKLWNACRFRQMQAGEVEGEIDPAKLNADDKWILLKLHAAITELTEALDHYKFNEAAQILHRLLWGEFCDWYLEAAKAALADPAARDNTLAVIDFVLSNTLRLFHPFIPFITEELWQGMGFNAELPAGQGGQTIMYAHWPKPLDEDFRAHYGLNDAAAKFVDMRNELVTQGRNLRRVGGIQSGKKVKFIFAPRTALSAHDLEAVKILLHAESIEAQPDYQAPKGTPTAHCEMGDLYLPLEGVADVGAEKERLTKELAKVQAEIDKAQQKLNNPSFSQKAPPAVLAEHQQRLADWQAKHAQLAATLAGLA